MCVCDLGGVYIKPTRPWVVAPIPSSLATIKRRRPVSLCQLVQLTCSPCHLVTWVPGYLFTSGHLVTWSSASHLVIWSSGQLVVWRLASVLSCLLLSSSVLVPAVAVCRLSPAVLCCRRVVSSACRVLCCRVVSSVCWRLSCLPVAFAPFTFAPSFRPSRFHYSPSPNSSPCGKSLLVVPVVSILTFPALILQALSFFWQDYSLASY